MKQNCIISRIDNPDIAQLFEIDTAKNLLTNLRVLCTKNPDALQFFVPEVLFQDILIGNSIALNAEAYDEKKRMLFSVEPLIELRDQLDLVNRTASNKGIINEIRIKVDGYTLPNPNLSLVPLSTSNLAQIQKDYHMRDDEFRPYDEHNDGPKDKQAVASNQYNDEPHLRDRDPVKPPDSERKKKLLIISIVSAIVLSIIVLHVVVLSRDTSVSNEYSEKIEEKIKENTESHLVVTSAPLAFAMPAVEGMDVAEAEALLTEKGLVVSLSYEKTNNIPENHVISQSVAAGDEVHRSDTITLVVCSGRAIIPVPNVVGQNQDTASATLKDAKFTVNIAEDYNETIPAGTVISQNPAANTEQTEGAKITIVVSKGRQPVTVSFDANGGSASSSSAMVYVGGNYGTLPSVTRTGYSFTGWYTDKSGGFRVDAETIVTNSNNHTLYAQWSADTLAVRLDANGGSVSPTSIQASYGGSYGTLPTPTRSGYSFTGWYTAKSGGTKVDGETKVSSASNHTLYAQWSAGKVTVSFDANGGSVSSTSIQVTYGSSYGTLPTPSRSGYNFTGWYTAKSGGTKVDGSTKVSNTSNHTLYAQWSVNSVTVTLDANGGSVSPRSVTVTYDGTYGTLPTPSRSGYNFTGWYTAKSGGTKVNGNSTVSDASNHTLYAHWEEEIPGYLSYYSAPSSLGSDLHKPIVSIEGDLYQFPCPVRAFLKNGWTGDNLDDIVAPGPTSTLTLTRNGKTIRFGNVSNPLAESTTVRNCVVEGIIIDNDPNENEYWNSSIILYLPNNITLGSSREYVMSVLPSDFKKETDYYGRVFYRYTIYNNDSRYIGDTSITMDQTNSYVVGISVTQFYN